MEFRFPANFVLRYVFFALKLPVRLDFALRYQKYVISGVELRRRTSPRVCSHTIPSPALSPSSCRVAFEWRGVTAGRDTWELHFRSTDLSADSAGRLEKDTWIKCCFSWEKGHLEFRWRGLKSPLGHENPHKPHFTASNAAILRSQDGKEFYFFFRRTKERKKLRSKSYLRKGQCRMWLLRSLLEAPLSSTTIIITWLFNG